MQCLSHSLAAPVAKTSLQKRHGQPLCRPFASPRVKGTKQQCPPRHVGGLRATNERTEQTPASPPAAPSLSDPQEPVPQAQAQVIPEKSPLPFQLIQIIAGLGVAETLYLTVIKYTGTQVLCPTTGCLSVLASPYASLYGLPLPVLGVLAYTAAGVLATNAATSRPPSTTTTTLLMAASTALLTTSASLMYVLYNKLGGQPCVWCITSAILSLATFKATIFALSPAQGRQAAAPALAAAAATAVVLWGGWKDIERFEPDFFLPYAAYQITQPSPPGAVDLARRLKEAGARMYGAFWCSHCQEQKALFGAEAMAEFPYQECYPDGWEMGMPLAPACQAVPKLEGFPTWVIGGEVYDGERTFEELEAALAKAQAAGK